MLVIKEVLQIPVLSSQFVFMAFKHEHISQLSQQV